MPGWGQSRLQRLERGTDERSSVSYLAAKSFGDAAAGGFETRPYGKPYTCPKARRLSGGKNQGGIVEGEQRVVGGAEAGVFEDAADQ